MGGVRQTGHSKIFLSPSIESRSSPPSSNEGKDAAILMVVIQYNLHSNKELLLSVFYLSKDFVKL